MLFKQRFEETISRLEGFAKVTNNNFYKTKTKDVTDKIALSLTCDEPFVLELSTNVT